ncbi:MAG: hypothetical protein ABJA10_07610 [Aestuariivirga sp.]
MSKVDQTLKVRLSTGERREFANHEDLAEFRKTLNYDLIFVNDGGELLLIPDSEANFNVYDLPETLTHPEASPRSAVTSIAAQLRSTSRLGHYMDALEKNEKIATCCRQPIKHDIVSYFSPVGNAKNEADIYIFVCTCGKAHRRVCMGQGDVRPMWSVR